MRKWWYAARALVKSSVSAPEKFRLRVAADRAMAQQAMS